MEGIILVTLKKLSEPYREQQQISTLNKFPAANPTHACRFIIIKYIRRCKFQTTCHVVRVHRWGLDFDGKGKQQLVVYTYSRNLFFFYDSFDAQKSEKTCDFEISHIHPINRIIISSEMSRRENLTKFYAHFLSSKTKAKCANQLNAKPVVRGKMIPCKNELTDNL